jgi:hypothetical protein
VALLPRTAHPSSTAPEPPPGARQAPPWTGGTAGKGHSHVSNTNTDPMRRAHARVAAAMRWHGEDSHVAQDAKQRLRVAAVADLIARSLDEGLLTDEHRRDLAALLTGGAR